MPALNDKKKDIEAYRRARFIELGFTKTQAGILSLAKGDNGFPVDTHKVRRVLEAGCTHTLAFKIFGPL